MSKINSRKLKFANSKIQDIDFEIKKRPTKNLFLGIFFIFLQLPILLIGIPLTIMFVFPRNGILIKVVGMFILSAVISSSVKLLRLSKRYLHNPAKLLRDKRPPILYLRSFGTDTSDVILRINQKTPEELLTSVLSSVGPVIAVGKPNEAEGLPLLGATRIYMDENWKSEVEKLMKISQLVVINTDDTASVVWELETAWKVVKPNRLILSFLSRQEFGGFDPFYKRFRNTFKEIFSSELPKYDPNICFVYFETNKIPTSVSLHRKTPFNFGKLGIITALPSDDYLPRWKIKYVFKPLLRELKKEKIY